MMPIYLSPTADPLPSVWVRTANHQKAMRLLFVRAYMRAGLSYEDTCNTLRALGWEKGKTKYDA